MFDRGPMQGHSGSLIGGTAVPPVTSTIYHNVIHDGKPPAEDGNSEIVREGRELDRLLGQLGDELIALESRLDSVLVPVPASSAVAGASAPTPRSRIAEGIAEANRRLSSTISHVQSIRQRLDL